MELKMSKKVLPDSYPTTVKKLLSTWILERARVKYATTSQERELPGIMKGSGYLCGCSLSNFSKIFSAYEFELHAGGKTRHLNNHIYLENGKPIYSVIQELKIAPHNVLDEVVKKVAGSSVNEESFQAWQESLQENSHMVKAEKRRHISVPGMHHATTRILGVYEQGNEIVCSCCHTEISPSYYWNIYTSSRLTLHDIALSLANGENLAIGSSDDMCAACGAGGDLIICDRCPGAFHVGYYSKFVKDFSKIAVPLTQLTHKGVAYERIEGRESAFQELKARHPIFDRPQDFDVTARTLGDYSCSRAQLLLTQ
ncbi:hypothetical protein HYC85_008910 [Camellia sinensis]|uniref:Tify domain-containing protein n=1 Tax=Camellia sinensis TaxID=4442 RepID=A0A7J7HVF2_CAMSI|nr:hypothetical protein HYC85_008910 [Camellia sinensis]